MGRRWILGSAVLGSVVSAMVACGDYSDSVPGNDGPGHPDRRPRPAAGFVNAKDGGAHGPAGDDGASPVPADDSGPSNDDASSDDGPGALPEGGPCTVAPGRACATKLALGDAHSCALRSDGTVSCWGRFGDGQLGIGGLDGGTASTVVSSPTPVVGLSGVTAIAVAQKHSCAATGAGAMWCWGTNVYGRLGDGVTAPTTVPASVVAGDSNGAAGALLAGVTSIGVGQDFSCAVAGGTAYCWGRNSAGQLGTGALTPSTSPRPRAVVSGAFVSVAPGATHACAFDALGAVWCWGNNARGQLGQADAFATARSPKPLQVTGVSGVVDLASGSAHTCALTGGGDVLCWGENSDAELGVMPDADSGVTPDRLDVPTPVVNVPTGLVQITAGSKHTCGLRRDGTVYCWGSNYFNQLGNTNGTASYPMPVDGITTAVEVRAGSSHTCAALLDGSVKCWGFNNNGQVGPVVDADGGAITQVSTPTTVVWP